MLNKFVGHVLEKQFQNCETDEEKLEISYLIDLVTNHQEEITGAGFSRIRYYMEKEAEVRANFKRAAEICPL